MQYSSPVPVLIVGAGPVGLTMSALLTQRGIHHLVVDKHEGISTHPKARGISASSLLIFDRLGIGDQVRGAGLPEEHHHMFRGSSLIASDFTRSQAIPATSSDTGLKGTLCPQPRLEALLLAHIRAAGTPVRFGVALESFEDLGEGVRTTVVNRATGEPNQIECDWLVACDGAGSLVRSQLGIEQNGATGLRYYMSIRFQAPLGDVVADRLSASYFIVPPGRGGFMAVDNETEWIFQYPVDPEHVEADDLTWIDRIRTAVGLPDLPITLQDRMLWRMDAWVAATFRVGPVFLAGDAAHVVPPTGGYGMNLGIGDADNLAWKLAAVIDGNGGEALLESYSVEREPVAAAVLNESERNSRAGGSYLPDENLLLSPRYVSSAIGAPGNDSSVGQVGTHSARIPEVSSRILGPGFTVVSSSSTEKQGRELANSLRDSGATVDYCCVNDVALAGTKTAILVRPDGYIAWRGNPGTDSAVVLDMMKQILAQQ